MLINSTIISRFDCNPKSSSTFLTSFGSIRPARKVWWGVEGNCGGGFRLKRRCKGFREVGLEEEILEFMRNSKKPDAFPLKKDLIDAGRMDLVHSISTQGGWLSLGWDLDLDKDDTTTTTTTTTTSYLMDLDSTTSSSGREPEVHDTGIEGILSRLEKQRNMLLRQNTPRDKGSPSVHVPDTPWKSWMKQRAGSLDAHFEAAEITFSKKNKQVGAQYGELLDTIRDATTRQSLDRRPKDPPVSNEKVSSNHIRARIQNLERELTSALLSLRSTSNGLIHQKVVPESSDEDIRTLSDDWEFRENEIMRAQDRLRSTRAKLAVLQGKMALAIVEAQKKTEEKQKKIDHSRRALSLLRTACIVWPNSASEVLLTGSFDGWSSQREMERSDTGIFSTYLKLYPGIYEIKFIVDGVWKIDPLRPIANNGGYENNLLIVM